MLTPESWVLNAPRSTIYRAVILPKAHGISYGILQPVNSPQSRHTRTVTVILSCFCHDLRVHSWWESICIA